MHSKRFIQLVDDPIYIILWMLQQLPDDVAATYLGLLMAYATYRSLLSEEDQTRLSQLLEQVLSSPIDRAA